MGTTQYTTEAGRFAKNNPGRPPGIKEVRPREPRLLQVSERLALAQTAAECVIAAGLPEIEDIIKKLAEKARAGDVPAATVLLKHCAPPLPRTVARGAEDIARLPPDRRLAEIAKRAAAGAIDLESAAALSALARAEIEARVLQPLRAALLALKAGKAAGEVLAGLAEVLDDQVIDIVPTSPAPADGEDDPAAGLV